MVYGLLVMIVLNPVMFIVAAPGSIGLGIGPVMKQTDDQGVAHNVSYAAGSAYFFANVTWGPVVVVLVLLLGPLWPR